MHGTWRGMDPSRLLARGWYRDAKGWWRATSLTVAWVLALVLVVVGVFSGMEEETESRVADMFTGDVRVTPSEPAAAQAAVFTEHGVQNVTRAIEAAGGTAHHYYESTYVLSRRGLENAYLEEQEGYQVETPGVETDPRESYKVGLLMGVDLDDDWSRGQLREHMQAGSFPQDGQETIQLMMSLAAYERFLDDDERANLTAWPPNDAEIKAIQFEITTARIDPRSPFKDIIRKNAVVVGLYETGIDAVDRIVVIAGIDDVRMLDRAEGSVNAIHVETDDPQAIRALAADSGWGTEDSGQFARRYVGQLMDVLQALTMTITILFFVLPAFLLWYGLSQQMDRNQREIAVCRAVGVPRRMLVLGTLRLGARVVGVGLAGAAVATLVLAIILSAVLPGWRGSPVPLGFYLPWWASALAAGIAIGSLAVAVAMTARNQARRNLATELRSP